MKDGRWENPSLLGEVPFIGIGSRCQSCDGVFDFPHPLDVGTVWEVCFPGGNKKMIRDLNSVPGGSQLGLSFVSRVRLKAPGGF